MLLVPRVLRVQSSLVNKRLVSILNGPLSHDRHSEKDRNVYEMCVCVYFTRMFAVTQVYVHWSIGSRNVLCVLRVAVSGAKSNITHNVISCAIPTAFCHY